MYKPIRRDSGSARLLLWDFWQREIVRLSLTGVVCPHVFRLCHNWDLVDFIFFFRWNKSVQERPRFLCVQPVLALPKMTSDHKWCLYSRLTKGCRGIDERYRIMFCATKTYNFWISLMTDKSATQLGCDLTNIWLIKVSPVPHMMPPLLRPGDNSRFFFCANWALGSYRDLASADGGGHRTMVIFPMNRSLSHLASLARNRDSSRAGFNERCRLVIDCSPWPSGVKALRSTRTDL